MEFDVNWGSHLPVLMKVLGLTTGDVLELGMGLYSTPYLHWACYQKRLLVSYDNNQECFDMNKNIVNELHQVKFVREWDVAEIEKPWDVVLVDHNPSRRRIVEITRLVNYAKYVVVHDTQRNWRFCDYKQIYPLFKYQYFYTKAKPWTTVLSNFEKLDNLC